VVLPLRFLEKWRVVWHHQVTHVPRHRLVRNGIPGALVADIDALLADPFRAALASGEADTKPAIHD
jgi:hypothetical protein